MHASILPDGGLPQEEPSNAFDKLRYKHAQTLLLRMNVLKAFLVQESELASKDADTCWSDWSKTLNEDKYLSQAPELQSGFSLQPLTTLVGSLLEAGRQNNPEEFLKTGKASLTEFKAKLKFVEKAVAKSISQANAIKKVEKDSQGPLATFSFAYVSFGLLDFP